MTFTDVAQLVGGLALFLYGMKLMSETLQHVAGARLKSILSSMTRNRFAALLSGVGITTAIQSSSATTVMLVGFVNAGLVTMEHSVGVIMGANIGTTITAWIVAFLGFKVSITSFSLPAVAIGVTMLFLAGESAKRWSYVLIGFGLMFMGLSYLKGAVPDSAKAPEAYAFISSYTGNGFGSLLFFVFFGTMITIIVQSSSATTAITITMAFNGLIDEASAFCMILGENIGTTITANIAAITGNLSSRKTALAHTVFNLIGVTWAIIFFDYFKDFVAFILPGDPGLDPRSSVQYRIAAFHSMFNVTNTLLLIGFTPTIVKIVNYITNLIVTGKGSTKENRYQLFRAGSIEVSELAFAELEQHMRQLFSDHLYHIRKTWLLVQKKYNDDIHAEILELESETDRIRNSILVYLSNIQEQTIAPETSRRIHLMSQQVKMIEEIGDQCARIARKSKQASNHGVQSSKDDKSIFESEIQLIDKQLQILLELFDDQKLEEEHLRMSMNSVRKTQKIYRASEKELLSKMRGNKKVRILNEFYVLEVSRIMRELSRNLHYLLALSNE